MTQTSCNRSTILLAPAGACLRPFEGPVKSSDRLHNELVASMQRLRGEIYLKDGAIQESDLTASGRHVCSSDEVSWHLLTVRADGVVLGCMRFLRHPNTVGWHQLRVSQAPLARSSEWGKAFAFSINSELEEARRFNFSYVEMGGWALAPELRGTAEALSMVLSTYALSQLQGGALGITTATERNGSASILRRLGGRPLEWDGAALPPYYDNKYQCGMQVLRFDSRNPCARYASAIEALRGHIATLTVVCPNKKRTRNSSSSLFPNMMPGLIRPGEGLAAIS